MAEKKRRKRKILFTIEIIVLAVLCLVLVASIWLAHKFSLINHVEVEKDNLYVSSIYNSTPAPTTVPTQIPTPTPQVTQTAEIPTETVTEVPTEAVTEEPTPEPVPENPYSGYQIIGLVGIDSRVETDPRNSDTMILACLDHNNRTVKLVSIYRDTFLDVGWDYYETDPDTFSKANAAYCWGGPNQFLSMVNKNLDLNVTDFVSVRFKALADTIELLGGLDIDLNRQEIYHLNNYNVETAEACGYPYVEVPLPPETELDGAKTMTFHLNGTQAVSYARIRYTAGGDFRRAARQRLVLEKVMEKAKQTDLGTLNAILDAVLPEVTTSLDNMTILNLMTALVSYDMVDQIGFPFAFIADNDETRTGTDSIIPVTLAYNVILLHNWIYPEIEYYPSETVININNYIVNRTGYGEESIPTDSETGQIPVWTEDMEGL